MKIFTDQKVKRQFIFLIVIILLMNALGQISVKMMAQEYKLNIMEHDYGVAGYLSNHNQEAQGIAASFTAKKTLSDIDVGQELLGSAGYQSDLKYSLIPEVNEFYQKYALMTFILTLGSSILLLGIFIIFHSNQQRVLETAEKELNQFLNGDHSVRLMDVEEGALSKLFTSINEMATSLTAHVLKERQNKEYLRDTISDISHQLKTPLAALQMYNEIILNEENENQVVTDFSHKSERELNRMEYLIKNLLKLAKLDADTIVHNKTEHKLQGFLEEVAEGFQTRATLEEKSIHLTCEESISLVMDEEWMREAVSNLIKNSLDHMERGGRIDMIGEETPILKEIRIKDNGQGIHPDDIHHIFTRFYRSRFSKEQQGIGIGLTLTKSIIEKQGGTISVSSEIGKGTIFTIAFPKLTNL